MGKHARRRRRSRGHAAVGSAAALALVVILAAGYAATSGEEAPDATAIETEAVTGPTAAGTSAAQSTPPSAVTASASPTTRSPSTRSPSTPPASPTRGPGVSPSPKPSKSPRPSGSPSPGGNPALSPAQRACEQEVSAADVAVTVAAREVTRWQRHLDATAVLLRRPDDPRATTALRRTRVGAREGIARFNAADRSYRARFGACAELAQSIAASRCQRRTTAANATVAWGRAAIDDWSRHLEAAQEAGRDPRTARLVTSAQPDISAFRSAHATLRRAPSCPLEEIS